MWSQWLRTQFYTYYEVWWLFLFRRPNQRYRSFPFFWFYTNLFIKPQFVAKGYQKTCFFMYPTPLCYKLGILEQNWLKSKKRETIGTADLVFQREITIKHHNMYKIASLIIVITFLFMQKRQIEIIDVKGQIQGQTVL